MYKAKNTLEECCTELNCEIKKTKVTTKVTG